MRRFLVPVVPWAPEVASQTLPSSALGRLSLAVSSAFGALRDPERADLVALVGDATSAPTLARLHFAMSTNPVGRRLLRDKPCSVRTLGAPGAMEALGALPAGTFGKAYHTFMSSHGFDPSGRPAVSRGLPHPDHAYALHRYRQCHDYWHCLTGLETTVQGEISQKAMEWAATGLPVAGLAAVVGPLRLTARERANLAGKQAVWAAAHARTGANIINVYYEELFEENVEVVRQIAGISSAPPLL